ncbi:DUF3623 family protein [Rhodobacterales bacterium HKCCE4037]|nr:DUF3623 family protein [Rhodobacterales bacterium HKCCE4037]
MTGIWGAILLAVLAWWFFTGAILLVIRLADRSGGAAYRRAVVLSVPLLALGTAAVILSAPETGLTGVYAGFLGALGVWGWIEMAFLTGVITGPEVRPAPPGINGQRRFWAAWQALAHHELLLLFGFLGVTVAVHGQPNSVALWTYGILFFARISAKLNLFFGVPRINLEFIPGPLDHLKSHLRQGPITPAFPIAITALSFAVACFINLLISAETQAEAVGFALLTTLSALALLEHWLMVLPLPDARLWRWMLPDSTTPNDRKTGRSHGL